MGNLHKKILCDCSLHSTNFEALPPNTWIEYYVESLNTVVLPVYDEEHKVCDLTTVLLLRLELKFNGVFEDLIVLISPHHEYDTICRELPGRNARAYACEKSDLDYFIL